MKTAAAAIGAFTRNIPADLKLKLSSVMASSSAALLPNFVELSEKASRVFSPFISFPANSPISFGPTPDILGVVGVYVVVEIVGKMDVVENPPVDLAGFFIIVVL